MMARGFQAVGLATPADTRRVTIVALAIRQADYLADQLSKNQM
jgi:hypothetical protein